MWENSYLNNKVIFFATGNGLLLGNLSILNIIYVPNNRKLSSKTHNYKRLADYAVLCCQVIKDND